MLGNYYEHLGFIGEATKLISELNPNGILAIFLPTLIFESAFKSEWYMLKKQFGQTIILGVPCVILASFMIMAAIKLIVGFNQVILPLFRINIVGEKHFCWLVLFVALIFSLLWPN